jgi:alpha-beta hydrolase superfamily lysophospholipase
MADGTTHETGTLRAADGCPLFFQVWRPAGEARGIAAVERVRGRATAMATPVLFLHGEQDPVVLVGGAPAFYEAISTPGKTMHVYPGGLHEFQYDIDHSRVMANMLAWLDQRS